MVEDTSSCAMQLYAMLQPSENPGIRTCCIFQVSLKRLDSYYTLYLVRNQAMDC